MDGAMQMIGRGDQRSQAWSGGSTTEMAIFPPDSDYASRNFGWRVSAATIDVEDSVFTPLPGIWRTLVVIEGHILLDHEGHHRASLRPFQQDSFSGSWSTKSSGRGRDFNVMVSAPYRAEIKAVHLDEEYPRHREIVPTVPSAAEQFLAWTMLYAVSDSLRIKVSDGYQTTLHPGDLLLVHRHQLTEAHSWAMTIESEHLDASNGFVVVSVVQIITQTPHVRTGENGDLARRNFSRIHPIGIGAQWGRGASLKSATHGFHVRPLVPLDIADLPTFDPQGAEGI